MAVVKVAETAPVFRSIREIVLSPQLGTQRLPKPVARPEQGRFCPRRVSMVAATLLVLGSNRDTLSLGLFETQT